MWWLRNLFGRPAAADPEPGPWHLYIFPGGRVDQCHTRRQAIEWTGRKDSTGERRAINQSTGEHIVWGESVWRPHV